MRALLSVVLSICLLVSSMSPAFAQFKPGAIRPAAHALAASPSLPPSRSLAITRQVNHQVLQAYLSRFTTIMTLPDTHPHKIAFFHHDVITWAAADPKAAEQSLYAVNFYRENLMKHITLLKDIPSQPLSSFLQNTSQETLDGYLRTVSSAGALAMLGSAQDAMLLISFCKSAEKGPLKEIAQIITARGLLRFEAYEIFDKWVRTITPQGEFWSELEQYVQEKNIPVSFSALPGENVVQTQEAAKWLEGGCRINRLNAYPSRAATERWLSFGKKDPAQSAAPVLSETPGNLTLAQKPNLSIPLGGTQELFLEGLPAFPTAGFSHHPGFLGRDRVIPVPVSARIPGENLFAAIQEGLEVPMSLRVWWARRFGHRRLTQNKKEPAGLHDRTVTTNYVQVEVPSDVESGAGVTEAETIEVPVTESGFKFTVERKGEETILSNVNVEMDPFFKSDQYNRLTLDEVGIFQLRNLTRKPEVLDHLYFELSNQQGELWRLLQQNPGIEMTRPLRIKFERVPGQRKKVIQLPIELGENVQGTPAVALIDAKLLPKDVSPAVGNLRVYADGSIYYEQFAKAPVELKNYYIRLPKGDSKYWAPMMQACPTCNFTLRVRPTTNKMTLLAMQLSMNMLGMGKTISPELKSRSSMSESGASTLMFAINNITPVLMGFLRPVLEKHGEAKILRIGSYFFVGGGATALASGLYGGLGSGAFSPIQMAGFLTSTVAIAIGTNITRLGQNLAIGANLGVVKDSKRQESQQASAKSNTPKEEKAAAPTPKKTSYDWRYLTSRTKDVFTKKPDKSADATPWFQVAQMFKNLGTLAFLAFPWLANITAKALFKVDLGLDFSASYVPYSILAAWTAYRLSRTSFKDAIPTNRVSLENNFLEAVAKGGASLRSLSSEELVAGSKQVVDVAKKINKSLDPLAKATVRHDKKLKLKPVVRQLEERAIAQLREELSKHAMPAEDIDKATSALQDAFNSLDHRDVKMRQVLRVHGVASAASAMVLATVHELTVSNGFAFAMRKLIADGPASNALTALALYGAMSVGRLLGNGLSRRISPGSLYTISSALSLGGTATMIAAGGNLGTLVTGAVIASLGVGNFFSQMFTHMVSLKPEYKREISFIINYTMPAAAVLSMPMRDLVSLTGFGGMDLVVAGGALVASLILSKGMFAGSGLLKAIRNEIRAIGSQIKQFGQKKGNPPSPTSGLDEAATAQ